MKPTVQLAMPLFATAAAPDAKRVLAAYAELFPQAPAPRHAEKDGVHSLEFDGHVVMITHIGAPVPAQEIDGALRRSWMWQGPPGAARAHESHAIVASPPEADPITCALAVARVSAALLHASDGVALYWGASQQVHKASVAKSMAESDLPTPLWVGITLSGAAPKGPFSAATHGLEALGHKEFEARAAHMGIGDLRMTLLDLASYVLRRGPVLKDGQTFGPDEGTHWTVRHVASELVPGRDVIVLGIP
ncbi:MAG TPA: DUF4261 domain-containing protein [Byssovorax sp.]